jgi:phage terminase large subunit
MKIDLSNSTTSVFRKNLESTTQFTFNKGGTRSSKTYSVMQVAYLLALLNENATVSVCSQSLPHLRRGAMKDFLTFLKKSGIYDVKHHNKSEHSYSVGTSVVEFFGVESETKVYGAGRDFLVCDEIQFISYETFFQLAMRTTHRVFATYNPVRRFWVDTGFLENKNFASKCTLIKSTLLDNEFCPQASKDIVLARAATDSNYRRVFLEGETGSVEGLVYDQWSIVSSIIPEEFEFVGLGLDWGYSGDPAAITAFYKCQNKMIMKEICYQTKLLNKQLINNVNKTGVGVTGPYKGLPVVADNAEPKSIDEFITAGINCQKVRDKSIVWGIKKVKEFELYVTEDSYNIINEFGSYEWDKDNNDEYIEYPKDKNNHAMDSIRYFISHMYGVESSTSGILF